MPEPETTAGPQLNEHGYPDATPVASMEPAEQAAYWKHQSRKHEARASQALPADELEALRAAKAELDTRKAAELTDAERVQAAATAAESARTAAERERDELRAELLRVRVAAEKGLTTAQAARLQGTTQEELEADAEALKSLFTPVGTAAPARPTLQHGSDVTPAKTVSAGEARYQARFGKTN